MVLTAIGHVVVLQNSMLPQWLIEIGHWIERVTEPLRQMFQPFLSSPIVLGVWLVLIAVSLGVLWWDLWERNHVIGSLMKLVWTLSVLFSGPIALAVYWWTGRTQIDHDSVWRGGWRSTSHCYSGCGIGEVVGVSLASAVFGFGVFGVVVLTFALAYFFGYLFNIGPLLQDGVPFREALTDTAYSETLSITGMEIAAIGADLILAPSASITDITFWTALFLSMTIGYFLAYPLNLGLISRGVKGGMANPAEMGD
jgi:hypothetical protein